MKKNNKQKNPNVPKQPFRDVFCKRRDVCRLVAVLQIKLEWVNGQLQVSCKQLMSVLDIVSAASGARFWQCGQKSGKISNAVPCGEISILYSAFHRVVLHNGLQTR